MAEILMEMRQATPDQVNIVLTILDDVAQWMKAKGVQQWDSPPLQSFVDFVTEEIPRGDFYLAWLDGAPVGTIRLDWDKSAMWLTDRDAGYVYTLAVHPAQRGKRIGERMLDWAAQYVYDHRKRWVRLDCVASNQKLRSYYAGLGFTFLGVGKNDDDVIEFAMFEKEIGR
jgi:ribosomal protein S18 acetylase RimI-like enzyme